MAHLKPLPDCFVNKASSGYVVLGRFFDILGGSAAQNIKKATYTKLTLKIEEN
jgi:hypothetical protein